jgi:SAM-dependent methyltransferase
MHIEAIYRTPEDYDLEHVGHTDDIQFFVDLAVRLKPARVLELACGSGRVTVPLAEAGARHGFDVVGVELVPEMLEEARRKREEASAEARRSLAEGDMRSWKAPEPFDLILVPCSSVCHLLTLEDQLAAWRGAWTNLRPDGRFVVDVRMPDIGAYADSFRNPARELVEIDLDRQDPETGVRMIRYRTTRYAAHEQRARIRYLYDKFVDSAALPERAIGDYESHVYYPRELTLLFLHTGFEVETIYGDYRGRPLGPASRHLLMVGRKPAPE